VISRLFPKDLAARHDEAGGGGAGLDPLTKLMTRAAFLQRLVQACRTADGSESDKALVVVDISEYHSINISYGEDIGNRVLQRVADHLNGVRRERDCLARIGDDQFTLLLNGILGIQHAMLAANKVKSVCGRPLVLDGDEIPIRLNMGVSLLSRAAGDPNQLFSHAMKALYRSKTTREQIVVYEELDRAPEKYYGDLLLDFSRALDGGRLELMYQAKQELTSDRICGAEALLRWNHPERGYIQPSTVVQLAEKAGRADSLTSWIINQAVRGCSSWLQKDMPIAVSINLEAHSFNNALLPAHIKDAMELWRVEPRFVILEITESTLMEQNSQVPVNIEEINRIGVRISIDDFGTGYSSLAYLNRLDVHELKIDKSFIDEMNSSARDEELVTAIINLGKSFGLKVTAEGVETAQQHRKLKEMGCDIAQGYYVSPPLAIDSFIEMASDNHEDGAG
jgi:diguanylate cyclase (GGDEF)-like protein